MGCSDDVLFIDQCAAANMGAIAILKRYLENSLEELSNFGVGSFGADARIYVFSIYLSNEFTSFRWHTTNNTS